VGSDVADDEGGAGERAVLAALARATGALPGHEDRPQQRAMARAVARAIGKRRHLVVEAGTGTGKSLAYLVPAIALGARVVVSTATKALQDQLAERDLPMLERSLGKFRFAVLKGRSNYICLQRVEELAGGAAQEFDLSDEPTNASTKRGALGEEVWRLVEWAQGGARHLRGAVSGDRAELPFEPSEAAWAQVSTGWRECPGASECPSGSACFAELARERASEAEVVVVNTHLYATALALGEAEILGEHDVVVFDEAHELEDIATAAFGFELGEVRLVALARLARSAGARAKAVAGVEEAARLVSGAIKPYLDKALPIPLDEELAAALGLARERVNELAGELRSLEAGRQGPRLRDAGAGRDKKAFMQGEVRGQLEADGSSRRIAGHSPEGGEHCGLGALGGFAGLGGTGPRGMRDRLGAAPGRRGSRDPHAGRQRAHKAASHLLVDLNTLIELPPGQLAWVEGPEAAPVIRVAPIDVGAALTERLWSRDGAPIAVMTSATVPPHLGEQLGLQPENFDHLDVGSPFNYQEQALLYCPLHLPDPRAPGFEQAMHKELIALTQAAQGRTLALFTSWRAMHAAAEAARPSVPWRVLTQSELPKPKLVAAFSSDEHSCLFATMGFWQGVDVPGRSLSLVTIDRLPFPRPDNPLLSARRSAAGPRAFELIDLPRAATLLAQGAGRLVRSRSDRGVVAVFDRRLGTASYRWTLVHALPPMKRTRSRDEVVAFLAGL
jgi:ATP-dependent DNA helicase DinG